MLACVLAGHRPATAHPRHLDSTGTQKDGRKISADIWRLAVHTDAFSGETVCRLNSRDGRITYIRDAIGFRFGRRSNVMRAWFRVDDSPALRWRDQMPELARLRVVLSGRDMSSPTEGIVWLPAHVLDGARTIAIQPRPRAEPRTFSLAGLAKLLATDEAADCMSSGLFVQ